MNIKDRQEAAAILHDRIRWFMEKHAPEGKRESAEFQADFMMVTQAIHNDCLGSVSTMLKSALMMLPDPVAVFKREGDGD